MVLALGPSVPGTQSVQAATSIRSVGKCIESKNVFQGLYPVMPELINYSRVLFLNHNPCAATQGMSLSQA